MSATRGRRGRIFDRFHRVRLCAEVRSSRGWQRSCALRKIGRMVAYRRVRVPGGTYFFTLTLADRGSKLLVERIDDLRCAFRTVLRTHPARVDAIAVLPDHLHAIWSLPARDSDYSNRWRLIKNHFTRRLRASAYPGSPNAKGEYAVWQSRFWEHQIRDDEDLAAHINYIHYNPVKHGLAGRPSDWRWSSFHRFVDDGRLPADWAGPSQGIPGCASLHPGYATGGKPLGSIGWSGTCNPGPERR